MSRVVERIEGVEAHRLNPGTPARAACLSLPVPPGASPVSAEGLVSQGVPIAWWNPQMLERLGWASDGRCSGLAAAQSPRRQLMTLVSRGELPERISFTPEAAPCASWDGPQWSVGIVDRFARGTNFWEVGELVLRHGNQETALRLGLHHQDDGFLWWEWLQVEELWSGPACRALRCAGYIPDHNWKTPEFPTDNSREYWIGRRDVLHQDAWVLGEMVVLIFRNGVVHITARHINNHLYNRYGNDLAGVVPVCGIRGAIDGEIPLAGEAVTADLGEVRVSTEECRSLSSPDHPGRLEAADGLAVLRPYEAITIPLYSFSHPIETGRSCEADAADPQQQLFPKGVARTFRFCLSFGAAPARVERYGLPYWWYGMLAELTPQAFLPVHDDLDSAIEDGAQFFIRNQRRGTFDDGSVRRYGSRPESGWEGETALNLFRHFYRDSTPEFGEAALRCAYNLADIGVDHISFLMRMHGYDAYAISPTMNRSNGILLGYLETGDPYLRETCENLALAASSLDDSNWPRRSYGRDATYIRGLILLEDYLPGRGHGVRARDALGRLVQCITSEGYVTQQSGTVGPLHSCPNDSVCTWQNFHVLEPVMDWLERHPQDAELISFFRRVCDWLAGIFVTQDDGGFWPQDIRRGDSECHPMRGEPLPYGQFSFPFYAAKSMLLASILFDDPKFLRMWEQCLSWLRKEGLVPQPSASPGRATEAERSFAGHDHAANKTCESLTWHQIHRWRARWVDGKVEVDPYALPEEGLHATIVTPSGLQEVRVGPHSSQPKESDPAASQS